MAIGLRRFKLFLASSSLAVALIIAIGGTTASSSLAGRIESASLTPPRWTPHWAEDAISLFNYNCAPCHDRGGQGYPIWRSKGQPNFTDAKWQKTKTDKQLFESISNGKAPNMPRWKGTLTAAQINMLIKRVRAFAPLPAPPAKNGGGNSRRKV